MPGPRSPQEYGDGPLDDAALEADGWAAGLDVWGPVTKAYANALGDSALANSQLWSLREAIRAELRAEEEARVDTAEGAHERYKKLIAERDRLILAGVDPAELLIPLKPIEEDPRGQ